MIYVSMQQALMSLPVLTLVILGLSAPQELPMQPESVARPAGETEMAPKPTQRVQATPRPAKRPEPVAAVVKPEQACRGQDALVCLVNDARRQHGLATVKVDSALMQAAAAKGNDMQQCGFEHEACGRDTGYWPRAKGYDGRCSGENIAWKQSSRQEVFEDWMSSPAHRANILRADFRDVGVNMTPGARGPLWTMILGGC